MKLNEVMPQDGFCSWSTLRIQTQQLHEYNTAGLTSSNPGQTLTHQWMLSQTQLLTEAVSSNNSADRSIVAEAPANHALSCVALISTGVLGKRRKSMPHPISSRDRPKEYMSAGGRFPDDLNTSGAAYSPSPTGTLKSSTYAPNTKHNGVNQLPLIQG
jgi:hypothetical protein